MAFTTRLRERSRALALLGWFFALCLSALPQVAHAERTSLSWTRGEGAEGCIEQDVLRGMVESRLGRAVFVDDAPLLVRGTIQRVDGRFRVEVELVYAGQRIGLRALESTRARCGSLDDSLAVIVALLVEASDDLIADAQPAAPHVDTQTSAEPDSATPTHSETQTVALQLPVDAPSDAPVDAPEGLPLVLSMGLGGWGAIDALPAPALGVYGLIELTLRPWSLRAEGAYVADQTVTLGANRSALLGFAWGGLALCLDAPITPFWEAGGCLHARAGLLSGQGVGFDEASRGSITWLAAAASLRTRLRLVGPLAVELDVGLDVPLLRQRFVFETAGTTQVLHTLPVVAPFASLQLLVVAE